MDERNLIVVDSPDWGDVPPQQVQRLVEQLRNELSDAEILAACSNSTAMQEPGYWPQIILWVVGDRDLVDTTVRVVVISRITEEVLRRLGKVCLKVARFTDDNAGINNDNVGKVFKKVYLEQGEYPTVEDVSEDEQETVNQSPTLD